MPLAFVVLRENRNAQAVWILAPVALLAVVYWAVMHIVRLDSGGTAQLNMLFTVLVVGFSLIWLLAERIGSRSRFVAFLLAILIYFGFLGVNLLSSGFARDMVSITVLAAVSIPAIVSAFAIAALRSSRSFSKARFIAWAGAGLLGSLLIVVLAVTFVFFRSTSRPMGSQIVEVSLLSFFLGLVCFAGLLPFLLVLCIHPFWRSRLECVTGIRTDAR